MADEDVRTIVTLNLRHFPVAVCEQVDIEVVHPDAFLCGLHASAPEGSRGADRTGGRLSVRVVRVKGSDRVGVLGLLRGRPGLSGSTITGSGGRDVMVDRSSRRGDSSRSVSVRVATGGWVPRKLWELAGSFRHLG